MVGCRRDPRHFRPQPEAVALALSAVRLRRPVRPAPATAQPKASAHETAEQVLQLYREKYFDCNVQHFHEKLWEEHGIQLSYTWVKLALQTAKLVNKQKRRGTHRRRRPRRPLPGRLVHLDVVSMPGFRMGGITI
jgi:hypothetical protein